MHPSRMNNFFSFRSLFETREQHISRLAKAGQFDKLLKMGVEPELLEMHAPRLRDLDEAASLKEATLQSVTCSNSSVSETSRLAS